MTRLDQTDTVYAMKKGQLFIISGPSGVGKGTVIKRLLSEITNIHLAISATTRPPRAGEVHGKHYYFLTPEDFKAYDEAGKFLEWCWVHNNQYGTLKEEVLNKTNKGENVLIEIDTQGAQKIKKSMPECIRIFLAPPSLEILKERLSNRGTESPEIIEMRLKKVTEEIQSKESFDFIITNTDLEETVHKVKAFMLK